jgi:hypothetical protein
VQNCAQNGRKCTLFRPKTHFFAHFCRGEGRLFGRPKIGVLGGLGASRAGHFLCHVFRLRKTPNPSNRVRSQKSHASLTKRTAKFLVRKVKNNFRQGCMLRMHRRPNLKHVNALTFGACRKDGVFLF